jgi:nucleolar GTP-binding protein
MTSAAYNFKQI